MYQILFIFIGGGLGSLARFFVGKNMANLFSTNFPYGTLAVNIFASFILGLFIGIEVNQKLDFNYRAFLAIGFCGGFSTFSTFSADTLQLIQSQRYTEALLNIFLNTFLCLLATFVGIYFCK